MKVEPNIVISEFITNMNDLLHQEDTHNVDISEKVVEQNQSLKRFNVPYYVFN
jgi:hypothetical protein